MSIVCRLMSTATLLVFLRTPFFAQDSTTGAVSSQAPSSRGTTNAATSDAKDLPWKVLASPGGVLDPKDWPADKIENFATSCSWPSTQTQAEELIQTTIGTNLSKPAYTIIHIFYCSSGTKKSDAWYLFRSKDSKWGDRRWNFQRFTGQRIYGSPTVSFLFVHLNVKAVNLKVATENVAQKMKEAEKRYEEARLKASPADKKAIHEELRAEGLDPDYIEGLSRANKRFGGLSPEERQSALREAIIRNAVTGPDPKDPVFSILEEGTGRQFEWFDDWGVPSNYANVHYESAVIKRTPANVANFLDILKVFGKVLGITAQAEHAYIAIPVEKEVDVVLWGAGRMQQIGLPSNITIVGYSVAARQTLTSDERSTMLLGSTGAYNDEQLYWWDASIGIPAHKIEDLQYSASDNTVVASQVDKQSAYAMFNLMPYPVDLSDPKSNVLPRILLGFPFSRSPWDRLFVGGGLGIPLKPLENFQFFAGVIFNHSKQPATLTAGSSATNAQLQNDLKIKVRPKFTFGINVPVKSVLDKLLK